MIYKILTSYFILSSTLVFAREKTGVSFHIKDGNLIILDKINPRRVTFEDIHTKGRIQINMLRPESEPKSENKKNKEDTLDTKTTQENKKDETEPNNKNKEYKVNKLELEAKISKLIFDAKNYFFAEDYSQAWNLVNKAEKLSDNDYRIKTMKGSLLFETGDKDLAKKYWEESLKINPNQYELIEKLKEINEEK